MASTPSPGAAAAADAADAPPRASESARFVALWPPLSVAQAHAFEWAIVAVTCVVAAACLAGAVCAVPWARVGAALRSWCCCCWPAAAARKGQQQQPPPPPPPPQRQQFNVLWGARVAMQLLGALYVLSLTVPLQVWWAPASPMRYGGRGGAAGAAAAAAPAPDKPPPPPPRPTFPIPSVDTICRVSLGVSYGVLEPAFYLVVLFSCVYTLQRQGHNDDDDDDDYNDFEDEEAPFFYEQQQQQQQQGEAAEGSDEDDDEEEDEEAGSYVPFGGERWRPPRQQRPAPDVEAGGGEAGTGSSNSRTTTRARRRGDNDDGDGPPPRPGRRRRAPRHHQLERLSEDVPSHHALSPSPTPTALGAAATTTTTKGGGGGWRRAQQRRRRQQQRRSAQQQQPPTDAELDADLGGPREGAAAAVLAADSTTTRGKGGAATAAAQPQPPPPARATTTKPLAPLLSGPNVLVVSLAAGLTLPVAAAQAVAALFSRVITQLRYAESAMARFFAASVPVSAACAGVELGGQGQQQPAGMGVSPADCAACAFPVFSTLVSALFALLYSLWLLSVARRLGREALNARLRRRAVIGLGFLLPGLLCLGVALRGVSVLFFPYTLAHDATLLAYALCVCAAVAVASAVAVWLPLREGARAEKEAAVVGAAVGVGAAAGGGGKRPLLEGSGSGAAASSALVAL